MAGPNDPQGPQDPGGPYGPHGPHGSHGPSGQEGPFGPFEPMSGYGPSRPYPDPHGGSAGVLPGEAARTASTTTTSPGAGASASSGCGPGGVAVALVAALAAAVALLLVRGVLDIPVFAPESEGTMTLASTGQLALGSALAALAATAVLQLLVLATPQPGRFLAWIIALGTAAVMLDPSPRRELGGEGRDAGVYLVIGVVIGSLMATVARSATRD